MVRLTRPTCAWEESSFDFFNLLLLLHIDILLTVHISRIRLYFDELGELLR